MRFTKSVLTLLAVAALSSCTNTYHGARENVKDNFRWLHGKPSHMAKHWGPAPTGYSGQNIHNVMLLKPADKYLPTWHTWHIYNKPLPPGADGVVVVESTRTYTVTDPGTDTGVGYPQQGYGQVVQEIYFSHGSSRIGSNDRAQLQQFADSIKGSENAVALTVVGHASTRVDGVTDPIRRKEINFEMAQKRANAVTGILKQSGVTPAWIEAISRGDEEPNMNPGDKSQEAADRRAELYMNGQQQ
ncbi:MAG TPA: OmpA family protein [Patescibacteria group bacterium]|nr:OmpA family protein [Patescibacteria group bacterium]